MSKRRLVCPHCEKPVEYPVHEDRMSTPDMELPPPSHREKYHDEGWLRTMISSHNPPSEIADHCGVSTGTIRRWMAFFNIQWPPGPDAKCLYVLGDDSFGIYKIGISADVGHRVEQVNAEKPWLDFDVVFQTEHLPGWTAGFLEQQLHHRYRSRNVGEYADVDDMELFELTVPDLMEIRVLFALFGGVYTHEVPLQINPALNDPIMETDQ